MTRERSTKLNEADSEGDTEASMVRREALLQYSPAEPGDWRHRWESFLSGLKRVTSSGDYIPEIDGLRFIAISAVVLYHVATFVNMAQSSKGGVFELGARGVELFFVISGFVLAVPFAAQYTGGTRRVRLKDYFIRRLIRL